MQTASIVPPVRLSSIPPPMRATPIADDRHPPVTPLFRSPFLPRNTSGCYITGAPISQKDEVILVPISDGSFHRALRNAFFSAVEIDEEDAQEEFMFRYFGEHGSMRCRALLWRKLEQREAATLQKILANIGLA